MDYITHEDDLVPGAEIAVQCLDPVSKEAIITTIGEVAARPHFEPTVALRRQGEDVVTTHNLAGMGIASRNGGSPSARHRTISLG